MKKLKKRFFVMLYCGAFVLVIAVCQLTSNAVTVISETAPISDRTVIVIDPGHGGIDGGATSCTGVLESQTNLEISLKLNDILHLLGYETKMIRTTDTSIHTEGNTIASQKVSDLKNRVKIINETDNAILVSIHQNTYPDSKYSGAQVFYAKTDDSKELATHMQSALGNRKAKQSKGIYLMDHIQRPGILIECGFISNLEEAAKLNDPNYQNQLCCRIATALCSHIANT